MMKFRFVEEIDEEKNRSYVIETRSMFKWFRVCSSDDFTHLYKVYKNLCVINGKKERHILKQN